MANKPNKIGEPSDLSELENKSSPIWHFKIELNEIFYNVESQNKKRSLDENEKNKIRKNIQSFLYSSHNYDWS